MSTENGQTQFAICVSNEGYPASLELRKIDRVVPDEKAAKHRMVRVVDESGEDYVRADLDNVIDIMVCSVPPVLVNARSHRRRK